MKVLILGNSSIFQRKIYFALKKFNNIKIEVASRKKFKKKKFITKRYYSYNEGLEKTDSQIVYISLINSEHYKWATKALNMNKHVIIDKPLTINHNETRKLIKIAFKKKLLLSEAIVFQYDLRFQKIIKHINLNKFTKIFCKFHIPILQKNNFRNFKKYGGGCFQDMSPYAYYLINFFFGKKKYALVKSSKNHYKKMKKNFKLFLKSKNIYLEASFSFDKNYKNEIEIHNNSKIYFIDYFFSPPINKKLKLKIYDSLKLKNKTINFNRQNVFYSYLYLIFKLIRKKKYNFFYKEIENLDKIKKKIS